MSKIPRSKDKGSSKSVSLQRSSPQSLDETSFQWTELVGHESQTAIWQKLANRGELPQVMLISGRPGLGKRHLLAMITGFYYCVEKRACGTCIPCQMVAQRQHREVLWLDDSLSEGQNDRQSNRRGDDDEGSDSRGRSLVLEDAEALQDHIILSPGFGASKRIVVIPDIDRMHTQAANRLLKTLEEPPEHALVLMSSSHVQSLLPTILSRCVHWRLRPPLVETSLRFLKAKFGIGDDGDEHLREILRSVGQAPGAALRHYERLQFLTDKTGLVVDEFTHGIASMIAAGSSEDVLKQAESLARQSGRGLPEILDALERVLNKTYRNDLDLKSPHNKMLMTFIIQRRRAMLSKTRRYATFGQIALNSQFFLEDLGLMGRDAPE